MPQCWDRSRHENKLRHECHFVNSPWLEHSPCRLFLEGDFSASRCLPAGYASLLRNTSVSHTSYGQAHRSVLSERASETTRVGLVVANKQRIEGSTALCAALLELRLIRYEAILEQASVSCERSHQRLHWESHQIFYSRPLWTQTTSPPKPPLFPSFQLPSKHRDKMEI